MMKLNIVFTLLALISVQNQAFATGDVGAPANDPKWFSWDEGNKTLTLGDGKKIIKGQECVYDLSFDSHANGTCLVKMKTVSMTEEPLLPWHNKKYQYTQGGGSQLNLAGKIILFPVYLSIAAYRETSCMIDRLRFESMLNGLGMMCEAEDLAKAERILNEHPYDQDTLDIWEEVKKHYEN